MIDIFAFLSKTINTEYVSYSNFITTVIGILTIVTLIGTPVMQTILKKLNKLEVDNVEIKTLLRLTLLREGSLLISKTER